MQNEKRDRPLRATKAFFKVRYVRILMTANALLEKDHDDELNSTVLINSINSKSSSSGGPWKDVLAI